jgi:alkanesulfonate monooxygenase SsuD/methylene tetrahydromethanopterin reductase-like flavin-dependent oxidoreductase (luciferase family)
MPELLDRFRKVEELGFDIAWTADHFVDPFEPTHDWFEAWTLLAAAARETSKVRLGPLVSSITLRNPSLLARQAMTIDHLSDGRLELGIGAGGAPLDHSMTGTPLWEPAERVQRLRETVEIVDELLTTGRVTYSGKYYKIQDAHVDPLPVQKPRPPLVIAATSPRTIEVAAKYADSWSSYPRGGRGERLTGQAAVSATAERVALLDRHCAAIGRDPSSIRRSFLTWAGWSEPMPTPQGFAGLVQDYREVGINEFGVYWPSDEGDLAKLEAIAESLPELRSAAAPTDVDV